MTRETGPPHMRTFLTKCVVGDIVTEGEGNGKKVRMVIFGVVLGLLMVIFAGFGDAGDSDDGDGGINLVLP